MIKNAALAGLYLETWNLTNSDKTLSSPETMTYSTVPTRCRQGISGFATVAAKPLKYWLAQQCR